MKKLNQNGMTLVEVMIAAAISVIIGLAVMKITQTSHKNMAKIKTDGEFSDLRNYLRNVLASGENCTKTYNELGAYASPVISDIRMRENATNTQANTFSTKGPYPSSNYSSPASNANGARKYYEISNDVAEQLASKFDIYTHANTSPPKTLTFEAGKTVDGFADWKFLSMRAYLQDSNFAETLNNGVCSMFFEFERDVGSNSQRAFGSKTKSFFLNFSCTVDPTDGYKMKYCSENDAIATGPWKLAEGGDLAKGIYFQQDVIIGIDSAPANLYVTGAIYNTSDRNLKKNIIPLRNASNALDNIGAYSFDFKDQDEDPYISLPKGRQIGVMAQEVEKEFPTFINEKDGYKRVDYTKLVPVLIQAHREHTKIIKQQDKDIKELKRKVDILLGE